MKKIAAVVFALCVAASLWAGPLGLEFGWTVEDLKANGIEYWTDGKKDFNFQYFLVEAPHPLDGFGNRIFAVMDDEFGLVSIMAIAELEETSTYGSEVKSLYSKMKTALAKKYGKPDDDFDFLSYDSIWDRPKDFMYALRREEYHLAARWADSCQGEGSLVSLRASADTIYDSKVTLLYLGSKHPAAQTKKERLESIQTDSYL